MMPIAIIVTVGRASLHRARRRAAELGANGLEAQVCVGAAALRQTLEALRAEHESGAVAIVLDGDPSSNCMNAQLATTLYPECGVVSLLDDSDESSLVMALQSGADVCYPRDVSPVVLTNVLYALLRRRGGLPSRSSSPASDAYSWQLGQQAWVLEGPENRALPLTTAERAFLLYLTEQPGMRASHEDLMPSRRPG